MVGAVGGTQRVEVADQLRGADLRLAGEHPERQRLGRDTVGSDEVELGAVAGRDRGRLVHLRRLDQLPDHPSRSALGERDPLAQLQRRGLVGDPQREQLRHRAAPPRLGPLLGAARRARPARARSARASRP